MMVPTGGYIFPGFDLNHSYEDCDVFVSLAKMKEHDTAGITLSMKNCFGLTPATIYGTGAGVDEPSVLPNGGRDMVHSGSRQPSKSAPPEKDPKSPRQAAIACRAPSSTWWAPAPSIWPSSKPSAPWPAAKARGSRARRWSAPASSSPASIRQYRRRLHGRNGLRPDGRPRHAAL